MSTRYIWGKYNYTEKYVDYKTVTNRRISLGAGIDRVLLCRSSSFSLNSKTGRYSYSGDVRPISDNYAPQQTDIYPCVIFSNSRDYGSTGDEIHVSLSNIREYAERRYTISYWNLKNIGTTSRPNYVLNIYDDSNGNSYASCYHHMSRQEQYPSTRVGWVSDARASAYPNYDVSGSYFYEAETQDNIDPSSVNLPESIRYNSDITISITPSSDAQTNSYGNITYTYQYKFDNGSWTTIETTSETSVELHIPSDKSSIQARVLAQDDIGFTSSTYVLSSTVSIYASDPPSAPSSISVDRTVEGFTTTVTVGEATDTDGTIANYIFERKTRYGDWTQVQSSADLTFVDNPDGSWGTVQYRVCAVDNSGTKGPYITSETYTVLTDVIVIMGPSKKDFGVKIGNFNLSFYVIVAGNTSATGITVTVKIDNQQTFTNTVDTEELVTGTVEVTNLSEGQHTITVTASKGGYTTANETYTFRIEGLTLPEGGNAVQFQDSTGKPVIPISRAEAILFSDGRTLEEVIQSLMS